MSGRAFLRAAAAGLLLAAAAAGIAPPATATAATAATPAPPVSTTGLEYVALGDSYAAGYGLADLTKKPVAGCAQSALDYPHRLAASLRLHLTDVTCAGATTSDVTTSRQLGALPQIDALSTSTRLVTISIGGNDAGLFSTARSCIALSENGPIFGQSSATANCRSRYVDNGSDALTRAIDTTTAKGLSSTFRAIRHRAPNAAVVVVGYPAVFPDAAHTPTAGCYRPLVDASSLADGFPKDAFPFTSTDVAYLHGVQAALDRVTARAAQEADVVYVSTLDASLAHSGCATSGSYIAGITLTASDYFRSISLEAGALHPNARGVAFLAAQATPAIERALAPTPTPTPRAAGTGAGAHGLGFAWITAAALLVTVLVVMLLASGRRRRARRRARRVNGEETDSPESG
jgi:lysophospholipase L1-like esterase